MLNLILFASVALATTEDFSKVPVRFTGKAFKSTKQEKLVYKEVHRHKLDHKGKLLWSVTEYLDPQGEKIADLICDYQKSSPFLPASQFTVYRTGYKEKITPLDDGQVKVTITEGEEKKTKTFKSQKDLTASQGLNQIIVKNLEIIKSGPGLRPEFILPSHLQQIKMYLRKHEEQAKKPNQLAVELTLSNWFFRMFAPSMKLVYHTKNKSLLAFAGRSNIPDEKGKPQDVYIVYNHNQK